MLAQARKKRLAPVNEHTPLTSGDVETAEISNAREDQDEAPNRENVAKVPAKIARRLYISHLLSTWNSRVFEFGAVLYLASIYPGNLLPMSVYALSRGLAAILFAPAVGRYIDTGHRLRVVRVSIISQRFAVAASCVIFYLLAIGLPMNRAADTFLLGALAFLACIEKLGSIMNLVSVERDWVVVVTGENHESLKTLNAQMRRIDLVCKLLGPLFIASIDTMSTDTAILVNAGMNICSVLLEYLSIAKVFYEVPELQEPKRQSNSEVLRGEESDHRTSILGRFWNGCTSLVQKDLRSYLCHRMFLPSFAGALLYLTVLSFSGQMITWLLATGYDSTQIAIARTASVAFEVLATFVAPWLMGKTGTTRAGLWLINWQISCLAAGISIFWRFPSNPNFNISAIGLVAGTILSRAGLRGFDLCVQILVQESVESTDRGSFSSIEASWQNLFEICSYISTIVFSRPDQFKWPTLISGIAVGLAGILYAVFVRTQRGHLVHLPKCFPHDRNSMLRRSRQQGLERILSSDF